MYARQFLIENNIINEGQVTFMIKDRDGNWVDMIGLFTEFGQENKNIMENLVFKIGQRYVSKDNPGLYVECIAVQPEDSTTFIGKVKRIGMQTCYRVGYISDKWNKESFISEIDYCISQVTVEEKLTQDERGNMHMALGAKSFECRSNEVLIVDYPLVCGGIHTIRFNSEGRVI